MVWKYLVLFLFTYTFYARKYTVIMYKNGQLN